MFSQVGSCPKCGAPIYVPTIWGGITLSSSQLSCSCNSLNTTVTVSTSETVAITPKYKINKAKTPDEEQTNA